LSFRVRLERRWATILAMGVMGVRRALAIAVIGGLLAGPALSGCAQPVDEARTVQTHLGRLHQVVDVDVATPSTDRAPAITVTYDADVERPAVLAGLLADVVAVADDLDYPAYPLTLVPAVQPDSALTVGAAFSDAARERTVLATWLTLTDALLGDVEYVAQRDGETITVDSEGAAAHDVAEAQRIGHGTPGTTWIFRTGRSAFTIGGRLRPSDVALFQATLRTAGQEGQPVWARTWRLDRRATHVRLDVDVALGTADVTPRDLTVTRYGRTLSGLARTSLTTLEATRKPVWLTLHSGDDTFATWASGQVPTKGRDSLGRGWDAWLAAQAAAAS
jgi:hypothetical protein